jgi:hypothetical protein
MKTYGPYTRKDGRMHMVVVNDDKTKTTISYPKWIMQQQLGRKLSPDETVDHIDDNIFNNNPSNFQILTRKENALKSVKWATYLTLNCKCCGKEFKRRKALHIRNIAVRKVDGPFCSKSCVGKTHH